MEILGFIYWLATLVVGPKYGPVSATDCVNVLYTLFIKNKLNENIEAEIARKIRTI